MTKIKNILKKILESSKMKKIFLYQNLKSIPKKILESSKVKKIVLNQKVQIKTLKQVLKKHIILLKTLKKRGKSI